MEEFGEEVFDAINNIETTETKLDVEKHKVFQLSNTSKLQQEHLFIDRSLLQNDKYYRRINNFVRFYDEMYSDHLPVFITTDSFLHAWHKTFDNILIDLEQSYMYPILEKLLMNTINDLKNIQEFNEHIIDVIIYSIGQYVKNKIPIINIKDDVINAFNNIIDYEYDVCLGINLDELMKSVRSGGQYSGISFENIYNYNKIIYFVI